MRSSCCRGWTHCRSGLNKCAAATRLPPVTKRHIPQVKRMQRAWIGRSSGSLVTFALQSDEGSAARALSLPPLIIFTTRVETIYGAAFPPSCKCAAAIHSMRQAARSWHLRRSTPLCRLSCARVRCRLQPSTPSSPCFAPPLPCGLTTLQSAQAPNILSRCHCRPCIH